MLTHAKNKLKASYKQAKTSKGKLKESQIVSQKHVKSMLKTRKRKQKTHFKSMLNKFEKHAKSKLKQAKASKHQAK